MFDMTNDHVLAVYNQLKDRYSLTLTNTLSVEQAAADIADFMENEPVYMLQPFPKG